LCYTLAYATATDTVALLLLLQPLLSLLLPLATAIIRFLKEWGIDATNTTRGGLTKPAHDDGKHREIWLCQRKTGTLGKGLGKTTGWIHRTK
jgi:hypothetical protein